MEESGMLLPKEFQKLAGFGTGLSSEQRWYAAWEKLFPCLISPSSAYFESRVDLLHRYAPEKTRRLLGPAMTPAFDLAMQPMLSGPLSEVPNVLDLDELHLDHDGVFPDPSALHPDEQWAPYIEE
ncbi:ankyrin 3 [Fusarium sporotrichioides]|uniref:Ankyrin 3 n=1 Tax=Fusarium sporotrichioides TaxID=5514 RepID=A0A395SCA5_FUSSP|nr:ankyrin 3 [Fusarium sporotrichioides]